MLNFYTVIVLEVTFFMIFLILMANTNDLLPKHKRKQFLLLFLSVILSILAEWSGSVAALFGEQFREIHVWTKTLELSMTPVVPLLCANILMSPSQDAPKNKWLRYALIFHTGLEILSAFTGFIFFVDFNGVFCHGPFYGIYLLTYLSACAYVLWVGYRVSLLYQNKNKVMMESIILISQKMGFRTCVEGIETKDQYDLIASLAGDCYQGYYATKPVPIDGFLPFYQATNCEA